MQEATKSRAAIEQAKGAVVLAYGLNEDGAFAKLHWWSRNRNIKVRDLARHLVDAAAEGAVAPTDLQVALDALLHDLSSATPAAG